MHHRREVHSNTQLRLLNFNRLPPAVSHTPKTTMCGTVTENRGQMQEPDRGTMCLAARSFCSSMQDDLLVTFLASTSVIDSKLSVPPQPPYNLQRFITLLQVACRPLITGASMQRVLEHPKASPLSVLKPRFPRFAALRNSAPSSHPRFQRPTARLQLTLLAQLFAR